MAPVHLRPHPEEETENGVVAEANGGGGGAHRRRYSSVQGITRSQLQIR